jgi:PAS domain S-box-containing protein
VVENVIEAMVDAVLVVDVNGRVTLANTEAERLTGHPRGELKAMPVADLLIDESSGLRTVVRKRIQDGDILRREVSYLVTRTGERIPVSVTGSPVLGADGVLQGIVLVARDVREVRRLLADKEAEIARRRTLEEELRATNASIEDQLEQTRTQLLLAERRATLGTLAGGVGHELRNIAQIQVAAIDELGRALEDGADVTALLREVLPDLERVAEHITTHGRRLLQLARPGPDHVSPLDLNVVVRDVVGMLRGAGRLRRVDLTLSLPATPVIVTVNRTRIEQILVNLLVNAVDAIGVGNGAITIGVREDLAAGRVVCTVRDTGCGIPPEALERVFEPFYTTKPAEVGTGLGLSVARQIVKSYGGGLDAESTVGVGSAFSFDLPR